MPQLMCARRPADAVDFAAEKFVVCKATGVNIYGKRYEMGDELPVAAMPPRALKEIYDTPLRLIETLDYALADEQLLAAMMARPGVGEAESEPDDKTGPALAAPVVGSDGAPDKVRPAKGKKR